jgi:hypothetical protein
MPDPAVIACPTGQWTKVATNVVSGNISKIRPLAKYFQTFRLTGNPAPTDLSEAVPMFQGTEKLAEQINSNSAIDVYVYCKVRAGSVRVDL